VLADQFLRRLPAAIRPHLPPSVAHPWQIHARSRLLKLWSGPEDTIHYEIWVHDGRQLLELGLHCEAEPARNARIRQGLADYLFDLKAALGNGVELEEWDRGWTRLYETHPLFPLDEPRLEEIAQRTGVFVATVEPLYQEVRRTFGLER